MMISDIEKGGCSQRHVLYDNNYNSEWSCNPNMTCENQAQLDQNPIYTAPTFSSSQAF